MASFTAPRTFLCPIKVELQKGFSASSCVHDKNHGTKRCGESLSRSYGRCIAEFLKLSYPVRLSILNPPTSVGLRYGHRKTKFRRFSWHTNHDFISGSRQSIYASQLAKSGGFSYQIISLLLAPEFIYRKPIFPMRHAITSFYGSGILTRCPSTTLFSLALGPTNPTLTASGSETLGVRRRGF